MHLNLSNLGTEKTPDARTSDKLEDSKTGGGDMEQGDTSVETAVMESTEDVPPGLMLWRHAVRTARTPAQLNLCTQLLGNSIAWEKSIMKVVSSGEKLLIFVFRRLKLCAPYIVDPKRPMVLMNE